MTAAPATDPAKASIGATALKSAVCIALVGIV